MKHKSDLSIVISQPDFSRYFYEPALIDSTIATDLIKIVRTTCHRRYYQLLPSKSRLCEQNNIRPKQLSVPPPLHQWHPIMPSHWLEHSFMASRRPWDKLHRQAAIGGFFVLFFLAKMLMHPLTL